MLRSVRMFFEWAQGGKTAVKKFFDPFTSLARRALASKILVTDRVAESYSACWTCTSLIADTIAMMPRHLKLKTGRARRIEAENHPFYDCWTRKFNPTMDAFIGHAMMLSHAENYGDAFAIKIRDADDRVKELWPVHPTRVPKELAVKHLDGTWTYAILPDPDPKQQTKVSPIYLHERDLFHYTGRASEDGRWGKGIYDVAKESIGTATAANNYAGSLFGNGLLYGLYLTTDQNLSDEKYETEKTRWQKRGGLINAHKPLLLDGGQEIKQATIMSAQQSQMIESREFNVADIARFYGVPVSYLNVLMKGGKISAEDTNALISFCLLPRIVRYVLAHETQNLGPRDQYRYVLTIDHRRLMFGNVEQRKAYLKDMFSIGVYNINEVREWEGEDPIGADGNHRFVPANIVLIGTAVAQLREKEAVADQAEKIAEAPLPDPNAIESSSGAGGKEEKPPAPNDNSLDPANSPGGNGQEGKIGDTKLITEGPRQPRLTYEPKVLAMNLADWEAREVTALAANPMTFRREVELFYRDAFTRACSHALILASGDSLGNSPTRIAELVDSRLADLDDLYDRRLSEFAPAVAVRLASRQIQRVHAVREILDSPAGLPSPHEAEDGNGNGE